MNWMEDHDMHQVRTFGAKFTWNKGNLCEQMDQIVCNTKLINQFGCVSMCLT